MRQKEEAQEEKTKPSHRVKRDTSLTDRECILQAKAGKGQANPSKKPEKGVPAGQRKPQAKEGGTLENSFEATLRVLANISKKSKKNGTPPTAKAAGRIPGPKSCMTQKATMTWVDTGSPKSIGSGQVRAAVTLGQRNKARRKTRRARESCKERGSSQQIKSYDNFHGLALAMNDKTKDHPELLHEPRNFLRDEKHSANALINFMVVRSPSPYNGIIGRPGLRKIQAVPFTAHGMLKFLMEGGIMTIRSTTIIPAEYRMVTEAQDLSPPKEPTVTERIKVAIHLEYPD
ncbi:hypothetical protein Tco_1281434 [Tanacetum coccineum]